MTTDTREQGWLRAWNPLIALVATLYALAIPVVLVLELPLGAPALVAELLVTLLFLTDALVRYRYRQPPEQFVADAPPPRGTWRAAGLVVDLLAAVPVPWIVGGRSAGQLLRLLKLFRVAQLIRRWRDRQLARPNLLRLISFTFWMALLTHWIACGWVALHEAPGAAAWSRYLDGLYWSITTLSTVGYGDITPETPLQKLFTMGVMLAGVAVYGFIIGNIATILVNLDPSRTRYLQRMEQLAAFMNHRRIPADLRRRMVDYYRYLWSKRIDQSESDLLKTLPPSLRADVTLYLKRDLIKAVPIFRDADDAFIREVALELEPLVAMPGDYVVRAGERGRSMYFVSRGRLEVYAPDGERHLTTLGDGDFFGEIALLYDQIRTATVQAVDYCDLYRLERDLFERVLEAYPEAAQQIRTKASKRKDN